MTEQKASKKNRNKRFGRRITVTVFSALSIALLIACTLACLHIIYSSKDLFAAMPQTGDKVVHSMGAIQTQSSNSYKYVYAQMSQRFSQFEANSQPWTFLGTEQDDSALNGGKGGIYCISMENVRYTVYNIDTQNVCDGYTLEDFNHMWINSEDNEFYVIVNIGGNKVDLTDYYILVRDESGIYASRAIINCYEATEVILDNAVVSCTLLAPNAQVHCDNTFVFGQLLAPSVQGELALNKDIKFTGEEAMSQFMDILTFENDEVRLAAITYLKNHDQDNKYANHDANSDLWETDIEHVTELKINAYGESLENLANDLLLFPGLKRLVITNAVIDSLDLSAFSEMIDLEVSYSTISELNLSGLTKVKRLILDYNDNLKTIDLSSMALLEILSYNDTPLGWLDFSVCPNLRYLDCAAVEMSDEIDKITGESLQNLETLVIRYNKNIKSIEFGSFPNLKTIDCSNCSISKFDMDGCYKLEYFRGSYNQTSKVDFSMCSSLKYVEVYYKSLRKATIPSNVKTAYFLERCEVKIKDA